MTLGVTNSAMADRDIIFSQRLRQNAHCLELHDTMAASSHWTYGQGVRKAHLEQFFWELSSYNFLPLGLNHPLYLRNLDADNNFEISSLHFPDFLNLQFPSLANWTWNLFSTEKSNEIRLSQNCFEEDSTIKTTRGWMGFSYVKDFDFWIVKLNEQTTWIASTSTLPLSDIAKPEIRAILKLFFSFDIIGINGRIENLNKTLNQFFPKSSIEGLNLIIHGFSHEELKSKGISCDQLDEKVARLCFPTSVLLRDLQSIKDIITQ